MSATSILHRASPHGASPAEAALDAAVVRGIALIGVVQGFTRRVFGLGRVMKQVLVRMEKEGVDPHSPNSGFDLLGALNLLGRALHLADALRARLRTSAVALALYRPRPAAVRKAGIERQDGDKDEDKHKDYMADPVGRIAYGRTDKTFRAAYRQAIADMSDREVLEAIYSDLLCASSMLGETEEAARATALGRKAAALLAEVDQGEMRQLVAPREGAPDLADPGRADHAMSDVSSDPTHVPGDQPPPRAVERGPPA